jgi:hypothetical protein
MSYKGKFKPTNPQKYVGDATNIIYRSSWELKAMKYFDMNKNVLNWSSEELFIPYHSPVDNKQHRYFPDFLIQVKKKDDLIETYLIEVKPSVQTQKPTQKRKTARFLRESITYTVNQAKWRAADIFCQKNGWKFIILTEYELGIKKSHK